MSTPSTSLAGVIVMVVWKTVGFTMVLLLVGMEAIPTELYEAAKIDGATWWPIQFFITLPLLRRTIAVGLFAFLASWNEFLAALIFLTDADKYTLPVMLLNAQSGYLGTVDWGLMQGGIFISVLPCAILFLLLQRYLSAG